MKGSTFARAAAAIALGGLVLRVAYVFLLGNHPPLGYDGTWYGLQAGTIADGVGYVDPARYYSFRGAIPSAQFPPLWPGLLALVNNLGFASVREYRLTGGVVGTATIVMTAYLGRTVVNARVGLLAAGLVAVSPFMIAADGSLMSESLYIALVTAAVLVAVSAVRAPSLGRFTVLGGLLGLATLTRSDGLLIAVVLVAVTARCASGSAGKRLGLACVALVVAIVVLVPWGVRNSQALGQPVLLSDNSGSLFSAANCAQTYSGFDVGGWWAACAAKADPHRGNEAARSDAMRAAGLHYAREHADRLVVVVPARVLRGWGLWNPGTLTDAEVVESRNRLMQTIGWAVSVAVLGFAVAGGVMAVRRRGWVRPAPLLAIVGAATIVLAGSWGNERFRLVAEPEIAVFAAVAVSAALAAVARSRGAAKVEA